MLQFCYSFAAQRPSCRIATAGYRLCISAGTLMHGMMQRRAAMHPSVLPGLFCAAPAIGVCRDSEGRGSTDRGMLHP
jgi:hypothetical protein